MPGPSGPCKLTPGPSATPQFGGWLRNPRSLGVSLPVTELPPNCPSVPALRSEQKCSMIEM